MIATTSPATSRLDLKAVVASEWTKLRSVKSTWWTLFTTVAVMIGFSALLAVAYVHRYDRLSPIERRDFDPTLHSLRGVYMAQLAIGVLGVLAITNEYATGMVRNTFAAVPQRRAVLVAKGAVFGTMALLVGLASSFAAFFVGQSILVQKHIGASIGDPGVLRAVIGGGVFLAGIGLLGLGLGTLLRRTAGAIATLFGIVFVLPLLAATLPSPWNHDVMKVLPGEAGLAVVNVRHASNALSPTAGLAVFLAYVAAVGVAALVAIDRRDA